MITLSRDEARELAVAAQGLARPPSEPASKERVLATVRHLGAVQIDTIAVVARSHYLVLWSRLGRYDPDWLDELLHPDRAVFEYWAHAASIVPIELFPYFRRRMRAYRRAYLDEHPWSREHAHVIDEVRRAVVERGPLGASHFPAPEGNGRAEPWAWYGNKPTNRALDILWSAGELMVHRRHNFQRIYDLAERVHPAARDEDLPPEDEERGALAHRAALAMGVVLPRWLNDYFRTRWGTRGTKGPGPEAILRDLADRGRLVPVTVEELGKGYVAAEHAALLEEVRQGERAEHVTLLSPFDSLIWDRRRTLDLFDFDYRIECYTPAPKRRYGYYVMPILYRGRLVGRLDPKVDRRRGELIVRSLHLEPGVEPDEPLIAALQATLFDFAAFHGAETISVEAAPPWAASALAGP